MYLIKLKLRKGIATLWTAATTTTTSVLFPRHRRVYTRLPPREDEWGLRSEGRGRGRVGQEMTAGDRLVPLGNYLFIYLLFLLFLLLV